MHDPHWLREESIARLHRADGRGFPMVAKRNPHRSAACQFRSDCRPLGKSLATRKADGCDTAPRRATAALNYVPRSGTAPVALDPALLRPVPTTVVPLGCNFKLIRKESKASVPSCLASRMQICGRCMSGSGAYSPKKPARCCPNLPTQCWVTMPFRGRRSEHSNGPAWRDDLAPGR